MTKAKKMSNAELADALVELSCESAIVYDLSSYIEDLEESARRLRAMDWRPIETAPEDPDLIIEVYAPPTEGLNAMVSLCSWHQDAGWCIDELREVTHWRPHAPPEPEKSR